MTLVNHFLSAPLKTLTLFSIALLTACNPTEDDSFTPPINNNPNDFQVEACIEVPSTSAIVVGDAVTFQSCNETVSEYTWKLDGQTIGSAQQQTFVFEAAGNYNLELVIGDGNGATSKTNQEIMVRQAENKFMAFDGSTTNSQTVGFFGTASNDLFMTLYDEDSEKIGLVNFDTELEEKWYIKDIASSNWDIGLASMAKINQGWLLNITETLSGDAYSNRWVIVADFGTVQSNFLTNNFYHKVIPINDGTSDFLAIGNRVALLDNGQLGSQAILDHYDGNLNIVSSLKLHDQSSSSFGTDVTINNGQYHVLSFVQMAGNEWQGQYQKLASPNTPGPSLAMNIKMADQSAIKNCNAGIIASADENIFIQASEKLYQLATNAQVNVLPFDDVQKIHSWNDQVFLSSETQVALMNTNGELVWTRQMENGNSIGTFLNDGLMYFDRNVNIGTSEAQIYLASVNANGEFQQF